MYKIPLRSPGTNESSKTQKIHPRVAGTNHQQFQTSQSPQHFDSPYNLRHVNGQKHHKSQVGIDTTS